MPNQTEHAVEADASSDSAGGEFERRRRQATAPEPPPPVPASRLPSPHEPMAVARQLVKRMDTPTVWWRSEFYQHKGTHYEPFDPDVIARWLYLQTEHATYERVTDKGDRRDMAWAPNKTKIAHLVDALGVGVLQRIGDEERCMALTNGVLNPMTGQLQPHTSERFNLYCLPFAYDPEASCPTFERFLADVFPNDKQAEDFLGEWFGYVLSGRTDMHKIACLVGKRRSGKGTIFRLLTSMLGSENVAGINLPSLGGDFGTEGLIGKALAVDADVRWHSRGISDAVPTLLKISGEDMVPVARKHKREWNGQLGARVMLMSNDTPAFSDRSGALNGRLVYLHMGQSFFGREDIGLSDKLHQELPGILNWALLGLIRLYAQGQFTEPSSGDIERETAQRISDPMGAFIDDCIEVRDDAEVTVDVLFTRYQAWCVGEGRTRDSTTKSIFSRDLRQRFDKIQTRRVRNASGAQVTVYQGLSCAMAPTGFSH